MDVFPNRGVTLSASTLLVPEDDSANYTVRLASIPSGGNVTVAITGAGSGISVDLASLTFTPSNWNTARTVRVSAIDDPNPTHEMVTLTHTPTGGGYTGLTAPTLQVTATDNDAPSLLVTPTQLRVDENDDQTYTIRLNTQPTGAVTVTVSGAAGAVTVDTDAATGNQNTLTFTQTTWSANQTVTVAAGDDDNAMSETLTLSAHSERRRLRLAALRLASKRAGDGGRRRHAGHPAGRGPEHGERPARPAGAERDVRPRGQHEGLHGALGDRADGAGGGVGHERRPRGNRTQRRHPPNPAP